MIRFTTPTLKLKIKNFSLPEFCDVYVSFRQGSVELTKKDVDDIYEEGEDTYVEVTLTQEETKMFKAGDVVYVQVNWITSTGSRNATTIAQINSFKNLLDEVIKYGS